MNAIEFDLEACDGCRACVRACFVNVLRFDRARKRPYAAHPEDCVHCNMCELSCPRGCVTVRPDFERLARPYL